MLKLMSLLALTSTFALGSSALAQTKVFRAYSGEIKTTSQESKRIEIIVDTDIQEHRLGDPEIVDHGFTRHYLELSVLEGNQRCQSVLQIEEGNLRLCSGSMLRLSGESVLKDKSMKADFYVNGFSKPMGEVQLKLDYVQDGIHEGSIDETY